MTRRARVRLGLGGTSGGVEALLPDNYRLVDVTPGGVVLIEGEDRLGWTLDDYVLPRLASGLYFGEEIASGEYADDQPGRGSEVIR